MSSSDNFRINKWELDLVFYFHFSMLLIKIIAQEDLGFSIGVDQNFKLFIKLFSILSPKA